MSFSSIFNISTGGGWYNYKSKGISYSHELDNFYWYITCVAQFKDFSITGAYQKTSKDLSGLVIYLNENFSSIAAGYKKNNLSVRAGVMFPFTYGTKYGRKQMSAVVSSNRNIYIRDNADMFYVALSYTISWGKSIFNIRKSLTNSDWDNGVMKVQNN